jgi:hypothetical protein
VLTGPDTGFFTGNIPLPSEEDSRRGYLLAEPSLLFHYILYDLWLVPVAVFLADTPPGDFGSAERVLRLPVRVGEQGVLLLGGILSDRPDMTELSLQPGEWTLYSLAYNLNAWPSEEQRDLSFEKYATLTTVERYDFVLVPKPCPLPGVTQGQELLY